MQQPAMDPNMMMGQMPPYGYGMPMMGQQVVQPQANVNAQPAQFTPFASMPNPITQQENIDLIMDVPLEAYAKKASAKGDFSESINAFASFKIS